MSVQSFCRVLYIFSCLVVGSSGNTRRSSSCGLGWRAGTQGGSCSFDDGSLCRWSNEKDDDLDWTVESGVASVKNKGLKRKGEAVLTSPELCDTSQVCFGLRYKINTSRGGKLSIQRCNSPQTCQTVWSAERAASGQWRSAEVSFETYGSFTIRIVGEKTSWLRGPEIYIDDLTYTNSSCNQTASTQGTVNITTATGLGSINNTATTTTAPVPTQETLTGGSPHDVFDSAVSSGIAAATIAIAMLIAAVAVLTRYYVKKGRCRKCLLKNKTSSRAQNQERRPFTASNELYNVLRITGQSDRNQREIVLVHQPRTDEPEVNIYSDIDYTDATFLRGRQRSLPHSVKACTVNGNAEDSGRLTLAPAETTKERVYGNMSSEVCSKELQQGFSSSTRSEVTKEKIYQNVDTRL